MLQQATLRHYYPAAGQSAFGLTSALEQPFPLVGTSPFLQDNRREKMLRSIYGDYVKPIASPDGDILLEVECGENRGLLYYSRFCQGSKGPCISFDDMWLTPNEFQYISGRESAKDWKRSIRHQGKSLKLLLAKGILAVHPSSCSCSGCRISSPVNRGKLSTINTRSYETFFDIHGGIPKLKRTSSVVNEGLSNMNETTGQILSGKAGTRSCSSEGSSIASAGAAKGSTCRTSPVASPMVFRSGENLYDRTAERITNFAPRPLLDSGALMYRRDKPSGENSHASMSLPLYQKMAFYGLPIHQRMESLMQQSSANGNQFGGFSAVPHPLSRHVANMYPPFGCSLLNLKPESVLGFMSMPQSVAMMSSYYGCNPIGTNGTVYPGLYPPQIPSSPVTAAESSISDTSDPSSPPPNSSVEVVTVVTQEEGRPLDLTVIQGHRDKYGVASTKPTNPPPSKNSKGAFGMCHHKRDSPYSRPSVDRSATARIKSTKMPSAKDITTQSCTRTPTEAHITKPDIPPVDRDTQSPISSSTCSEPPVPEDEPPSRPQSI